MLASAVVAVVAFAAVDQVGSRSATPKYLLTANVNFPVSTAIFSGPVSPNQMIGCSGASAKLYAGVQDCLRYTVTNPLNVPISVTSLSISAVTFAPLTTNPMDPACKVTDLSTTAFAPSTSSEYMTVASGATAYLGEPITLTDHGNQDNCENGSFSFTISGRAQYTAGSQTVLVATSSPATVGQPVTLTATVSATTPVQSPPATTPAGSVTFYKCTTGSGPCSVPVATNVPLNSSGVASAKTTFNSQGTYYLEAVYTPADSTNFKPSASSVITEAAGYTSCITNTYSGNLTVKSGETDCITTAGKLTGNVTVNSGGRIDLLGGSVGGGVTVSAGGGINVSGGTISANINSTGATYFNVCSLKLGGNLSAGNSTAFVQAGDSDSNTSPACIGNTISGSVSLTGSSGGADVGGNTVSGGITVNNDTAGVTEIEHNTIKGTLSCSGNAPAPTDDSQPNTVVGKRSGQCAAAGF